MIRKECSVSGRGRVKVQEALGGIDIVYVDQIVLVEDDCHGGIAAIRPVGGLEVTVLLDTLINFV